jgi:hypothetical protein
MIGRNPKLKIIQTTHTGELAIRFGRKAKTLMTRKNTKKSLKPDSGKIRKQQADGKRLKVASILPQG